MEQEDEFIMKERFKTELFNMGMKDTFDRIADLFRGMKPEDRPTKMIEC